MKHRVLHILANLGAGGAERMAVYIVRGLNRHRFEPAVVAFSGRVGSDLEQQLDEDRDAYARNVEDSHSRKVKFGIISKIPGFPASGPLKIHEFISIINHHLCASLRKP